MSRMFLLFLAFALAACDSDFDKCMNTEIPRVSKMLKPEQLKFERILSSSINKAVLTNARVELANFEEKFQPVIDWHSKNPEPAHANYDAYIEWGKGAENAAREAQLTEVYKSIGYDPVYKMSESSTVYNDEAFRFRDYRKISSSLDESRIARAFGEANDCWGQLDSEWEIEMGCHRPFMYWNFAKKQEGSDDVQHFAMSPQGLYVGVRFVDETLDWLDNNSKGAFDNKIEKAATLACNANGLYE
jgi:hypothetical protein